MTLKILLFLLLLTSVCLAKPAKVLRVIDGDTFVLESGEHVRVVGINAPEMNTTYGPAAKEHLTALIDGKTVDIEPDHISKDKDVYGRLLRYVFLDGVDIDKKMVSDGFAIAYLRFKFDKAGEYTRAEASAKAAGLGIWSSDAPKTSGRHENANERTDHRSPIARVPFRALVLLTLFGAIILYRFFRFLRK